MINYVLEFVDDLPKDIYEKGRHENETYEASQGVICDYRTFSIVIRNDSGETIGALTAYSAFAEIYVDEIWVDSDHRKRGLGTKLLSELENRFEGKGFNNINLVTSQFQASGFYEKCGFELEFVRENKHNPRLTKSFFVKYFDDKLQTRGIFV